MTNYDEVPYPNLSHVQSHPDSIATLALLLGLKPAPVTQCRVLEIGCAMGGNLLPMAQSLPGSTFVGIDYSAVQIEAGQQALKVLGLDNVQLLHLDIMDVTPELGEFDYILAHGVYSWVPEPVRDRLLAICKQNLAPNGLAYVSYNVYPGWHMLGSLREMMLYHIRDLTEPAERAAQARTLLNFLAESVPTSDKGRATLLNAYSAFLKQEMARIGPKSDSFLLHDELEEINHPVYFHEFMTHAEGHGLQFVSEVEFRSALPNFYPKETAEAVMKTARSVVDMEQYLDFLRTRTFRQTILCHQGLDVNRTLKPESMAPLHIASRAVPEADDPNLHARSVEKFKSLDGAVFSIDHPVSKAAMVQLAVHWPLTLPFDELLQAAVSRLNRVSPNGPVELQPDDAYVLQSNLLKAFVYSDYLVEAHVWPPKFVVEVSERPEASPWARYQAQFDGKVTNLRHERVELDELNRWLIPYVDGTRTFADLMDVLLAGPVAGGTLVAQEDDQPLTDPARIREVLGAELRENLKWLARAALLVA